MTLIIGRYAAIPASVPYERAPHTLTLDLSESHCLRFALNGERFAVPHEGLQALLEAYTEAQHGR